MLATFGTTSAKIFSKIYMPLIEESYFNIRTTLITEFWDFESERLPNPYQ